MKNKYLDLLLFVVPGSLCLGNALNYFISGESYKSSNLRNYAVIAQILFAIAVIVYGFWRNKINFKTH